MNTRKLVLALVSILAITLVGFFAYRFLNVQNRNAFPLDDSSAKYYLEDLGNSNFVLNYLPKDRSQISIYVNSETKINLTSYLGKELTVSGHFVEVTNQVQCIKAPCPPVITTEVIIDSIGLK